MGAEDERRDWHGMLRKKVLTEFASLPKIPKIKGKHG